MANSKILSTILLVALFFLFGGGMILLTGGATEQSIIARVTWVMIYAAAIAYGFLISKELWAGIRAAPGFMLLSLLCLSSIAWSSARSTTFSYSIAIFGATLVTYLMVAKVEPFQLLQHAATALLMLILLNGALMLPNLAYNLSSAGRYSGIFTQPNVLGRMASMGVLLLSILMLSGAYPRLWAAIGILGGCVLVIACNSMTSILAVMIGLSFFFMRRAIGRPLGGGQILVVAWFLFCIMGLLWLNQQSIITFAFELMGRSPHLTGRTELWEGVRGAILRKPYLGYGYSGFWAGERILRESILSYAGWTTVSAHNGLYDIALHLGMAGVVTFIFVIGRSLITALKYTLGTDSPLAPVLLSILSYLLVLGATESVYMMRNSINWVLMVLCVLYLKRMGLAAPRAFSHSVNITASDVNASRGST
jgi:exopolysaccharide production protein ExoQ